MTPPLRILCSELEARSLAPCLQGLGREIALCHPGDPQAAQAEIAFVSRDITGRSTKFEIQPDTERFYAALRATQGLQWLHVHSLGLDRDVYQEMHRRGARVTASRGASDAVVAQAALAGVLALARRLPRLFRAQQRHAWEPLFDEWMPRDLAGQRAVIVGWGGIGQRIGALLQALGLEISVARHGGEPAGDGIRTVRYGALGELVPGASWLVLACPLSDDTRNLVDARILAALPPHAHLVNVARGHVVDEPALIRALQSGQLAGAFLDVFHHEPLPDASPLWDLDNVMVSPHTAGFSDGNTVRVRRIFVENLNRWLRGTL
ncbi:D-2-hydroxyacid dehydrogenase [Bordetella petrii]|nr:D-2-hydroxyacid dehydrogenase [Bordetella petrii]